MGIAYTPGLTVSPRMAVRRARRLPLRGAVLVNVGAQVEPGTVVARAELPGLMQSLKVAGQLSIEPADLPRAVLVSVGDTVTLGQIIARQKALFGLLKTEVKSPIAGTIETISSVTGNVGIRRAPTPIDLTAYLSGTVVEVMSGEGVVVQAEGALIQGIFGIGGERVGEIKVVSKSPEANLAESDITGDLAGKVIVGGGNISGAALRKASQVGVTGIIVGGIIDTDLVEFLGYDIGVAVTGDEAINLTLIITEGFGAIAMARRTYDLLASLEGKSASLNGATQIRAGVIRPEVIIPLPPSSKPLALSDKPAGGSLEIGAPIRLIREPYFGLLATVTALPSQLTAIESGAVVRVLQAKLADGRIVTVPRANVEMMTASP